MNCKQGDLAIYKRGPNAGTIVKCLKYVSRPSALLNPVSADCWLVDRAVAWFEGKRVYGHFPYASDHLLTPIRDNDNEDEILARVGKPERMDAGSSGRIGKKETA